jgi:conjugal transfer pilus assembly protein TraL
MTELEAFYIPKKLDEPERIIIWTLDEFGVCMAPFVLGIMYSYMTTGLVVGILCFILWRKVKGGNQDLAFGMFYWHLPLHKLLGLKATPPSHYRFFIG